MRLELSVLPNADGRQAASGTLDLARIIHSSGLYYRLTKEGTILEGSWDQLMGVAKQCHDEMLKRANHVTTIMHADDNPAKQPEEPLEDDGDWLIP